MSRRFRKTAPFHRQSRRQQRAAYIELKNNICRAYAILGGAFHTHDYLHGQNGWADVYFLGRKPPVFYNAALQTTRTARSQFPSAHSLMMDRATLLEHQIFWGNEDSPAYRQLARLRPDESALYDELRFDRIAPSLRLEQERIGFAWVNAELEKIGLK